MVTAAIKLRRLVFRNKAMTNLNIVLKSRDISLLPNVHIVKAMVFPVGTYECESWTIKKAEHWRTDAFELDIKEIKPVNPRGIFIGRTGAEAEAPILWSPDAKSQLTSEDPDARKDWRQEEKEITEDEMVGWHNWLNGHEFE